MGQRSPQLHLAILTKHPDKVVIAPPASLTMSLLTTQEMIAIAKDTKKAKAALAFKMSGMATVLTERDRKTAKIEIKASPEEKARYQALSAQLELSLGAITRTLLNKACDDLGIS